MIRALLFALALWMSGHAGADAPKKDAGGPQMPGGGMGGMDM